MALLLHYVNKCIFKICVGLGRPKILSGNNIVNKMSKAGVLLMLLAAASMSAKPGDKAKSSTERRPNTLSDFILSWFLQLI